MKRFTEHLQRLSAAASLSIACCTAVTAQPAAPALIPKTAGPNVVLNGAFGSPEGWTTLIEGKPTVDFNYAKAQPKGGSGPCLRIACVSNESVTVYQSVDLARVPYVLDGQCRSLRSSNAVCGIYIGTTKPVSGSDYASSPGALQMALFNTFTQGTAPWDSGFAAACGGSNVTYYPPKAGTYYLVMAIMAAKVSGSADIVIDNVSLAAALVAGAADAAVAPGQEIQWLSDITAAMGEAAGSRKSIVVFFHSPSFENSVYIDRKVFSSARLAALIREKYVPIRLDMSQNQNADLAQRLSVFKGGVVIVYGPDGNALKKITIIHTPRDLIDALP